jgi:hypothetical protein
MSGCREHIIAAPYQPRAGSGDAALALAVDHLAALERDPPREVRTQAVSDVLLTRAAEVDGAREHAHGRPYARRACSN